MLTYPGQVPHHCQRCGTEFLAYRNHKRTRKFCSYRCSHIAHQVPLNRCLNCKTETKNPKYCSEWCYGQHKTKKK